CRWRKADVVGGARHPGGSQRGEQGLGIALGQDLEDETGVPGTQSREERHHIQWSVQRTELAEVEQDAPLLPAPAPAIFLPRLRGYFKTSDVRAAGDHVDPRLDGPDAGAELVTHPLGEGH